LFNATVKKFVLFVSLFLGICVQANARADIKFFDLTNPFLRKIPMAVPVFKALTPSPEESELVALFSDQLAGMLDFSGYFKMLDRGAFLYDPQKSGITNLELNFANWTAVGAELLITGGVQLESEELALELRLFDTFKGSMLVGKRYRGAKTDQKAMIRRFCSEVMEALTGNPGIYFSTLAFVSNHTGHKEIFTSDFDGSNVRQITKKNNITGFPSWSSDGRYLAFTSFISGPSRIFIHELSSGLEREVTYSGVQIAPTWVPGRFEIAATLSMAGDQEIYLLTGAGKMIKRLTDSRGIDVEGSWSPDGKKMAFVSNRSGTPQIYIKDFQNGKVRRLTFEGQYNTQPSWSPKGDRIAYSSMVGGQINVWVIDTEGLNPIQLTHNPGDDEAPAWSPDGSLIAFSSTREGRSRIYVMSAFGTDQRRLVNLSGDQIQPKWSPNIIP
jgi:TolB protein